MIDAAIPFCVGVYCLLVGFRIVGKPLGKDPKFDAWHARFGFFLKAASVILFVLAAYYAFR